MYLTSQVEPPFDAEQTQRIHLHAAYRFVLIAVVVICFTLLSRHLQLDDALIYDRYVNNALNGFGMVYNVGEHINALTSPLYSYLLLSVAWLLHGQVQLAAVLIFTVAFGLACMLAENLVPYSGIFLSTMAYFYWLIGMETSVFLFFLMLSISFYARDQIEFLPSILVLTFLTRMEAGILILVIGLRLYRDRKIPSIVSMVPPLGLIVSYVFLNRYVYGHVVSDSSKAKFGQGMSGYWGVWPTAFLRVWHLWPFFAWTPYVLVGIVALSYRGICELKGTSWNRVILPFLALLGAFYWLFNLPAYHWYYGPFILFLSIFAVAAAVSSRAGSLVLGAVLIAQCITNAWWLRKSTSTEHEYAKVGQWLSTMTPPDAHVAACEIGEIGWVSHRYIIDILGLTTPQNAQFVADRNDSQWLAEDKPDYIVVHKPAWVWERVALRSPEYKETSFESSSIAILQRKDTNK